MDCNYITNYNEKKIIKLEYSLMKFKMEIKADDTIETLKYEIYKNYSITPDLQILKLKEKELFDNRTISDYNIRNGENINMMLRLRGGGAIDNIIDEEDKSIGFDLNLLKRDKLYVNLIHFDFNMTNQENYFYFNKFKVDVVGGFHAIDDLDILKKYLEKIKEQNIPFILICSGSSGKQVIPLCIKYPFIKEIIIFCANHDYNKHYIEEYPNYVKKVLTDINSLYKYIKTFHNNDYKEEFEQYQYDKSIGRF